MDIKKLDVALFIDEIEKLLDGIRTLEHQLYDAGIFCDEVEDDLIHSKLRLKTMKTDLYAIEEIKNGSIQYEHYPYNVHISLFL